MPTGRGETSESSFLKDDRAPKDFKLFQEHLAGVERRFLRQFQSRDGANLHNVEIATDKVERHGRNAIITDADGNAKRVVHQGKVFDINPDGTIKNAPPGAHMYYDKKEGKVVFDDGKVHIEYDPANDKSTYDFTNPKTKEKMHLDITSQGITESKDGKVVRFIPPDRSYSIDVDPATGKATVKGKNGEDMKADDPHKELLALNGKKVEAVSSDNQRGFTFDAGGGKERTIFPGSHSVLEDKATGQIEEVQYGKRTWKFSDAGGGEVKITADDGTEYKVKKADLEFGLGKGQFEAKLGPDKKLEVDPFKGSETITDKDKSTTKYIESSDRRPYTVEKSKDADGKWGVTSITDERGEWKFKHDPAGSRDLAKLQEVSGPGGTFKKGEKGVAGFEVSDDGEVTVNFKPGKDQKYKSVTFKPGSNQEVYVAQDGHKIEVGYEKVGAGAAAAFKPTSVRDGSHRYEASYDAAGNPTGLKETIPGKPPKEVLYASGDKGNAKSIAFDPESKGFKVTMNSGEILEFDPTTRSQRSTEVKDGKTLTTETFGDKAKKTEHSVVTEDVGGKKFIRSFTDTKGNTFSVVYNDDKDPEKGIKTILGPDGKTPIPEIGLFQKEYGLPKISVDRDGKLTLSNAAEDTKFVKHPEGKTVFSSPKYGEVRDGDGMVVETSLPRMGGKPEGGLTIRRAPGDGPERPLQSLTLKDTGESLTRNPKTGLYEYRDPADPEKTASFKASVVADADGNVFINGRPIGRDPSGKDILAALTAPPDVAPPAGPGMPGDDLDRPPFGPDAGARDANVFARRNRDRFFKDTRVERVPIPGGGTFITATNPAEGTQVRYTLDARNRLTGVESFDRRNGYVAWARTAENQLGYSRWVSSAGGSVWAKTEGPGRGVDQFGHVHFERAMQDNFGRPMPVGVSLVGLSDYYTTLLDGDQFRNFRRFGVIVPTIPQFNGNPRFARRLGDDRRVVA